MQKDKCAQLSCSAVAGANSARHLPGQSSALALSSFTGTFAQFSHHTRRGNSAAYRNFHSGPHRRKCLASSNLGMMALLMT